MEKDESSALGTSSDSDVTIISESNSEQTSLKSQTASISTQDTSVETESNMDVAISDQSSPKRDEEKVPHQPTVPKEIPSDSTAAKEIPTADPEPPQETADKESTSSFAKNLDESTPQADIQEDSTSDDEDLSLAEMRRRNRRERWSIILHVTGIPLFALSVGISVFTAYVYRSPTAIGVGSSIAATSAGVLAYLIYKLKQYLFQY